MGILFYNDLPCQARYEGGVGWGAGAGGWGVGGEGEGTGELRKTHGRYK